MNNDSLKVHPLSIFNQNIFNWDTNLVNYVSGYIILYSNGFVEMRMNMLLKVTKPRDVNNNGYQIATLKNEHIDLRPHMDCIYDLASENAFDNNKSFSFGLKNTGVLYCREMVQDEWSSPSFSYYSTYFA